jgi:hypothetical protein
VERHPGDCVACGVGHQDVAQFVDDLHPQPAGAEGRGEQHELLELCLHDEGAGATGSASGMTCARPSWSNPLNSWRMSRRWRRQVRRMLANTACDSITMEGVRVSTQRILTWVLRCTPYVRTIR